MKTYFHALLGLQLLIACFVSAEQEVAPSFQSLKLATGDNYFPFADQNMPHNGWSAMVVGAVFKKLNRQAQINVLPWPRAYRWTKEGKYDAVFPYVYTEKRAKDMLYSQPINRIEVKLFVMAESDIKHVSQIHGKRFCMPKGFDFNPGPNHPLFRYKLIRTQAQGTSGCLNQVYKNWADLGFINAFYNQTIINKHFGFEHQIRIFPETVASVPLYLLVSKQHANAELLIQQFDQALKQLQDNGELNLIEKQVKHWLETSQSQPTQKTEQKPDSQTE